MKPGFDPWVEKIPWRGKCYLFQYSGLENSKDCIVHGVAKSWTWLSDFHFTSLLQKKKKRWNNSKPKVHSNNPKSCPPLSQISLVCVWMVKTESSHWKAQVLAPSDLDFSPSPATFSPCDLGMFTYSVSSLSFCIFNMEIIELQGRVSVISMEIV